MADKNFIVKNGLEVGGQEVISSSGVVTSAALGGQTLASTDSPTFNNLTVSNDLGVSGDLNLTGDLNITGDLNSLSVTDLDVTDQTITLGVGQVESASGGSGIVVAGSNASLLWDETNDVFDFNKGVTSTGNVGIGTGATSPSNVLHVQETKPSSTLVYFKNASATAGSVLAVDGTGTGTGTKLFDARVSGTSKFMIYGDGTAEIARPSASGLANPLLVLSGGQGIMRLGDGQSTAGGPHGIQFDYYGLNGAATDGMSLYYRTDPEHISFEDSTSTSGSKVMVIERTGNVGIGTDEPDFKLHVNGTNLAGGIFVEDSSTANSSPIIKVQGKRSDANKSQSFSGGLVLEALYTGGLAPDTKHTGTIYFGTNHTDGTAANIAYSASISGILEGDANSATDMPTGLVFYTGDAGTALGTAQTTYGTERMRIDHDGQVGINVNDPSYKLHTRVTSGNNRSIIVAENTAAGSAEAGITVKNSAGEGRFVIGGSDHIFIENATEGKDIRFLTFPSGGTVSTEAMRILHTGRVGIGEDLPNANLHIGASAATGDATNPALQIGGSTTYRLGMYTDSEAAYIHNANGDNGIRFHVKTLGEVARLVGGNGALGVRGAPPSDANSSYPLIAVGTSTFMQGLNDSNESFFGNNSYWASDGSWHRASVGKPAQIAFADGETLFRTSSSAGSGSDITWVESARFTNNGNLKFVAQTTNFESPGFTYHTNNYLYLRGGSAGLILADDANANTIQIIDGASGYLRFETGDGSERMRINSSRIEIDPSNDKYKFTYNGSSFNEGLRMGAHSNGYSVLVLGAGTADSGSVDGQWTIARYPDSVDSEDNKFAIRHQSDTNAFTILKSGNIGIGVNAPSARLELDNPSAFTNMIEYGNVTWNQNTGHGLVAVNRGSDGYVQLQLTSGAADADVFSVRYSGTGANLMHNMLSNGNALHEGQVNAGRAVAYDTEGNLVVYGSGQNSLILQTPDNTLDRGIAFRNSGGAYIGKIYLTDRGSNVGDMVFGVAAGTQTLVTAVQERMRITKEGDVLVNTTAAFSSGKLDVRSAIANTTEVIGVKNDNSGSYNVMMKFYVQSNAVGRIDWDNTGSSMGFVNLSDARLKTVTGTAKGLSFINRLEPKTYNFKDNNWETEGLIAQEVKAAMEAEDIVVRGIREPETEDDYYGLDYGTFVPNLIQAIKELSAKNDALEARISELEG